MIKAGCADKICTPWVYPESCCNACTSPSDWELFDSWWAAVTEWLFHATGSRFSGACDVESEPCPPCGCKCEDFCGCGPWDSLDLTGALCQPPRIGADGMPCLEFAFPQEDGSTALVGPNDGVWALMADRYTVDWYEPFTSASMWPEQVHGSGAWTLRATVGEDPPGLLLHGAAKFVCEIIKDCKGEDSCLPDGVRSITRRNITADISSGFEESINFDTQGTGISQLDMALRTWGVTDANPISVFVDPVKRMATRRGRSSETPSVYQHRLHNIPSGSVFDNARGMWTWRARLNANAVSFK